MDKSVNYFIYFVVALYTLADIRSSVGQWEKCEGNQKLTDSAIWKCVKRTKCDHAKNLPPRLIVNCGPDELCCPEPISSSPPSKKKLTTPEKPMPTPTPTSAPTPAPATAFAKANRIAFNMCKESAQYRFINYTMPSPFIGEEDILVSQLNCTKVETLILNGDPAELTEYPHMALLGYDDDVTDSDSWRCGGSLISKQFILSAAHCTKTPGGVEVKWAALGLLSREDITADLIGKNLFQITQRFDHPEYQASKGNNDIALYKLKDSVEFSPIIRPICVHHQGPLQTNTKASVTGWGKTLAGQVESDVLLKATIRYFSNNQCAKTYANDKTLQNGFNASTMICAGDHSGKNDTCSGDSGGPMQILMSKTPCMWVQVGITSRGPQNCGETPAIYTRVAYYLPWIARIVWPTATSGKRPSQG